MQNRPTSAKLYKGVSFLLSYHHHPTMQTTFSQPSPPSRPLKWACESPSSPPSQPSGPTVAGTPAPRGGGASVADGPSVFEVLNIFRRQWFLNRDHLISKVVSAQKDNRGNVTWVDFNPLFHTSLVRRALTLLPPLCPVAKGKRVMFVFLLEILTGKEGVLRPQWALAGSTGARRGQAGLSTVQLQLAKCVEHYA